MTPAISTTDMARCEGDPIMKKYTHDFDILIPTSFQSDLEDFDQALNEWLRSFSSNDEAKNALIHAEEDLQQVIDRIEVIGSYDNEP